MKKDNTTAAWGMLSVIVSQLVLAPGILGGSVYFLSGKFSEYFSMDRSVQYIATLFAALAGLAIAFYRINQMSNKLDSLNNNDADKK